MILLLLTVKNLKIHFFAQTPDWPFMQISYILRSRSHLFLIGCREKSLKS